MHVIWRVCVLCANKYISDIFIEHIFRLTHACHLEGMRVCINAYLHIYPSRRVCFLHTYSHTLHTMYLHTSVCTVYFSYRLYFLHAFLLCFRASICRVKGVCARAMYFIACLSLLSLFLIVSYTSSCAHSASLATSFSPHFALSTA
jgi:hypothetical protein